MTDGCLVNYFYSYFNFLFMRAKVELCAFLIRLAGNVGTIDTSTWGGELPGRSPPAKAKF